MKAKTSRPNLFLLELILAILFFSLTSAICAQLFAKAHGVGTDSSDLSRSVLLAQSAADSFRSAGGALSETAALLGIQEQEDGLEAYYDGMGEPCSQEAAVYRLTLNRSIEQGVAYGDIVVLRDGKELYRLRAARALGEGASS